jgi:hypothetical protein
VENRDSKKRFFRAEKANKRANRRRRPFQFAIGYAKPKRVRARITIRARMWKSSMACNANHRAGEESLQRPLPIFRHFRSLQYISILREALSAWAEERGRRSEYTRARVSRIKFHGDIYSPASDAFFSGRKAKAQQRRERKRDWHDIENKQGTNTKADLLPPPAQGVEKNGKSIRICEARGLTRI